MTKQEYTISMKTHGGSKTKFYTRYIGIKRRCEDIKNKDYPRYGGRGIKFEWKSFEEFRDDMYESFLVHHKKHGKNTSIERIDSNGNYCKNNCIWATSIQQGLNKRSSKFLTVNGVTKNYSEWAKIIGCSRQALRYRVVKGLDPNLILTLPFNHSNRYDKTV